MEFLGFPSRSEDPSTVKLLWMPNIPSLKYFGPGHRQETVLIVSPMGIPIRRHDLPLSPFQIQKMFSDISKALQVMHKHGIVHGDVSLNNIVWKNNNCDE